MSDIRRDPDVIETFIQMDSNSLHHHWDEGGNRFIPLPIGSLAFFMRDKCQEREIAGGPGNWGRELSKITGHEDTYNLLFATSEQWIKAAITAWRRK